MDRWIEKVTDFIIRRDGGAYELLLFEHPYAGIQIPAGTVDPGETPEQAALREGWEESGLAGLSLRDSLGYQEDDLAPRQAITLEDTRLYARPDRASSDWAYLRRGFSVTTLRRDHGFTQIDYSEPDQLLHPQYVSLQITGWVPDHTLATHRRRHFFLLDYKGETPARWTVRTDFHDFRPFWAPISALPPVIAPQAAWLQYLPPSLQK